MSHIGSPWKRGIVGPSIGSTGQGFPILWIRSAEQLRLIAPRIAPNLGTKQASGTFGFSFDGGCFFGFALSDT